MLSFKYYWKKQESRFLSSLTEARSKTFNKLNLNRKAWKQFPGQMWRCLCFSGLYFKAKQDERAAGTVHVVVVEGNYYST